MKIHLKQIPADGLHLEGEEECPIAELQTDDGRCEGPPHEVDAALPGKHPLVTGGVDHFFRRRRPFGRAVA